MVPAWGIASPTPRRWLIGARTALLAASAGSLVACSGEPRSLASYIAAICSTPFRSAPAAEAPYLAENVAAMTKMMIDMGIRPSGDVDADFVAMMVPHHQGAIEMARAELRYGHNEQLKRIGPGNHRDPAAGDRRDASRAAPTVAGGARRSDGRWRRLCAAGRPQMKRSLMLTALLATTALAGAHYACAGQAPAAASDPDIPISHRDRVYSAEQYSNTVSVTDPASNTLVGAIRLGDPLPANLSPLYKGQLLVHGLGFSPDHHTIAVVAIASNAVNFIDTATNAVKHVTYVGRSPHEAFFTPDGREVWVVVRGENYVAVLDGTTYEEKTRIVVANGPGMTIFSPDGKYGYVCSSFTPETAVITVTDHKIVGKVAQASPFCPNIAATPDGKQVWFTLKDTGKTQVFDAQPPLSLLKTLDTGAITNHVNIVRNANGMFAYVTVGGLNEIQVFHTDDFSKVATIPTGKLPHGIWPSGDGTRCWKPRSPGSSRESLTCWRWRARRPAAARSS